MKKVVIGFFFFALISILSCSGFVLNEEVVDNYYIVAPDDDNQAALSYHEYDGGGSYGTIVSATVFAIGYNNHYLIIKQHPLLTSFKADRTLTNYYILPRKKEMDWKTKNGLIGPLTIQQFNERKKELNIESIKFTKVIKELE